MKYTDEELKNFVAEEYASLNLSESEFQQYVKYIRKTDNYAESHKLCKIGDAISYFQMKFEELYALFVNEGYTPEISLNLTRKAVLLSDRKELFIYLSFARAINVEQKAIETGSLSFRRKIELAHARKSFLLDINDYNSQTMNTIFKMPDNNFEKKFQISTPRLLYRYPLTDEIKKVWAYQASLTDKQLKEEFNLTREEIAKIYPTTKNELETVKTISNMKDEDIIRKYGITKKEMLSKRPLNTDTLRAIMSINKSSDKAVNNTFNKSKEEVLKLRTITTEMIKLAMNNKQVTMHSYTKEELKEKLKSMKKGTIQNG